MSRTPNSEQLIAIEAKGGILLSAGAGSGKTFVIVEHLIMQIERKSQEFNTENWKLEIPTYLRSIVLMTFTKKAAGEMAVRLLNRLEEKKAEGNSNLWEIIIANLNSIQISTIHGFCHRLISSGVWPEYPVTFDLLNETMHREKLRKLFNDWYELNFEELQPVFLSHAEEIFQSICEVFKNPDLRLMWRNIPKNINREDEFAAFFNDVSKMTSYLDVFSYEYSSKFDSEKAKKAIFKLIYDFLNLKDKIGNLNINNFEEYFQFVENVSRFPSPVKDLNEEDIEFRDKLKNFFDFVKDIKKDIRAFCSNYNQYNTWDKILNDVFNYMDTKYLTTAELAFSDLEYYVSIGLENSFAQEQVSSLYKYFIVDEFQDTSPIQWDIIKKCSNFNIDRLYCVGDKKQAIYGFRGGELQVFESCLEQMGLNKNLKLVSNYRSNKKVVNFNNQFFKHVLPSGDGFEGHDRHSVEMEAQFTPDGASSGEVTKFLVEVNDKTLDSDVIEAESILEIIKLHLKDDNIKSIAVLYRKLKPSLYLIELLQKNNIGFVAQTKIDQHDDPVIIMFDFLVRYLLCEESSKKASMLLMIEKTLDALRFKYNNETINLFEKNVPLYGLYVSFLKLLSDFKISNANYNNNLILIQSLVEISGKDLKLVIETLDRLQGSFSLELMFGAEKKVHILSTHTSKGLEYDAVIVAGIHKNGRNDGLKSKLGKLPRSFKWKADFNQKIFFNSPNFYIENLILKEKEFSESKRLLYVACTRAIKSLSFVQVQHQSKTLSKYSNSWINAFDKFSTDDLKIIKQENILESNRSNNISLMLKDNVGLEKVDTSFRFALTSELSVTRMTSLVECPFKFYLKNICKINIDENVRFLDEEVDEIVFKSSAERGSDLHLQISNILTGKIKKSEVVEVNWAIDELKKSKAEVFYSEKELKFSFFGNMISAIPDLYFIKNNVVEVWDFKSGIRDENKEVGYWFQLYSYAYGVSLLDKTTQDYQFTLKILYLDQKNIVSKSLKLIEIKDYLYSEWKKLENLSQVNLNHCKKCEYRQMCKSASTVATI